MRKLDFLYELKKELQALPEELVLDLLTDYEEHFEHGIENGKSEERICEELGSPKEVAEEYLQQYQNQMNDFEKEQDDSRTEKAPENRKERFQKYGSGTGGFRIGGMHFNIPFFNDIDFDEPDLDGLDEEYEDDESEWEDHATYYEARSGKGNDRNYDEEQRFLADETEEIVIEAKLESVKITEEDRDDIRVRIIGTSNMYEGFSYTLIDHVLHVKAKLKQRITVNSSYQSSMHIDIFVPRNWNKDVKVNAKLGAVDVVGGFHKLTINAAMGSVRVSGWHRLVDIVAKMGSIKLYDFCGSGKVSASMGKVTMFGPLEQRGTITAKASMGVVNISEKLLKKPGVYTQMSGRQNIIHVDDADITLDISASMGSISIKA